MVVAAADWAARVRPRWLVVAVAMFALASLLDYLDLEFPFVARVLILALLAFFYVAPWLVAIGRNFAAGYSGREVAAGQAAQAAMRPSIRGRR
jgi:hypothetical protein